MDFALRLGAFQFGDEAVHPLTGRLGHGAVGILVDDALEGAAGTFEVPAAVGSFDWLLPIGSADKLARLGISFSATAPLPNSDDRPVGAKLDWMEVFPSLPTYTFEFGKTTSARLASTGIDQDGWFARNATIQLPPFDQPHDLVLTFEYPGWSDIKETTIHAHWPGKPPSAISLTPGGPGTMRPKEEGARTP